MALPTNLVDLSAEQRQQSASSSCDTSVLHQQVYRRIFRHCAASVCRSVGFHSAQHGSLDALAVLLHQFFSRTCQSSRAICEHTGRTLVNTGDIFMALANEERLKLADFGDFLYHVRHDKQHTFTLLPQSPTKVQSVLRIAEPRPHPSHFPTFLPPFPEPHTYIRSEVHDETDTNYERVRRLDAQNKRDWEKSLVRYALATSDKFFSLQVLLPFYESRPYLSALLTDDADQAVDDEQHNYFARILSKEMDEDLDDLGLEENNCLMNGHL